MSEERKKRSRWKTWLGLGCVGLLAVVIVLAFTIRPRTVSESLPEVDVIEIAPGSVQVYGEYDARIRAKQIVEVHAQVDGFLQSMHFKEGGYIEKGKTLFVIDPVSYKAQVNRAQALLSNARAQASKAERDLERMRPLYEQNAASRLDLDNAVAAAEGAKADVEVCEADLQLAKLTLGLTNVVSPISGYISDRKADIGTFVGPSSGHSLLAMMFNTDTLRVDIEMTELDYLRSKDRNVNLGSLASQDSVGKMQAYVTITQADGTEYPYRGLVDFAAPRVDPETGIFSVRAEMPNPDHTLIPGVKTKVKVLLDIRENAIEIPAGAVVKEDSVSYVYVVLPDNTCEKRPVTTESANSGRVLVKNGLLGAERIVLSGFEKIFPGMEIKPVVNPTEKSSREK